MSRWIAAGAAFVVSLDSMVNIAFPAMAASFDLPAERVRWVIIGYVLTYALTAFAGGTAGDRAGHGRVLAAGLALSAAGYVACGLAPAFGWLVVGRVVQGIGGGLVYGTAPALVTLGVEVSRRGRALGFLAASMGLAFSMGPVLAGALVERFGWAAVFHVRAPLAVALLVWAVAGLPAARMRTGAPRLAVLDVVRAPVLGLGALAFAGNAGIFAIWLLAPFYLLERRGLDAVTGGALFMLTPLGTTLAAPLGGWLADRVGPRAPAAAGLALEGAALATLSRAEPATPVAVVALALFAAGAGLGAFQVPNMAAVMGAFPAGQQGAAGGFAFLARTLGTVAGVALLAEVFARRRGAAGFDNAFASAFLAASALVAAAAIAATLTGRRRAD
ncbi:MAG TPA: MFS transporter [Methylomirabilota bacterium]|nr:MFS transporter [Methylomirabilota bacterium]